MIGVLMATRARGLRVPHDLSIVGMTSASMAEMATPALTTVSFPEQELGHEAARLLLDRIDRGLTAAEHVLVRPELTIRGSTVAPREGVAR